QEELAAADRMASLGRLAASVGHEINNPLTYVLGELELLAQSLGESPLSSHVERARDGALRVRNIVRDLKDLSSGGDEPVGKVILRRVLDIATAGAAHEINHRARLVRVDGDVAPVIGTEARLVRVFVNLLINAAQSLPDGDVAGREIRIATHMAG